VPKRHGHDRDNRERAHCDQPLPPAPKLSPPLLRRRILPPPT
jgi:hypothetical protein